MATGFKRHFPPLLQDCLFVSSSAFLRNEMQHLINTNHKSICLCDITLHLADAFIQSDLQYIQVKHFLSVCVFPGNRTHNLWTANAML